MLTKLELKNYRQYENQVIEFVPGINTIVGANNSGKSTIAEAIEFALYGAAASRDSAKGYIRDGCKDGASILELQLGADHYRIGRNSSNAKIWKNGELDASYKSNVTAYVSAVTGCNHAGFGMGHYVRQKELNAFAGLRPGKRLEVIERMLRINSVDKAVKKIKDELDEARVEQRALLQGYRDPADVQIELDDVLTVGQAMQERLTVAEAALADLVTDLTACKEEQATADRVVAGLKQVDETLSLAYAQHTDLLERLAVAKRAADEVNELAGRLREPAEAPDSTLYALALEMRRVRHELLQPLIAPVEVPEPDPVDYGRLDALKHELASLPSVDSDSCPTCKQVIPPEYRGAVEDRGVQLTTAITSLTEELRARRAAYDEASQRRTAYVRALAVYDAALQRRSQLEAKLVEVGYDPDKHDELVKLHAAYVADKRELDTKRGVAASIEDLEKTLATVDERIASLQTRVEELPRRKLELEAVSTELATLEELHTGYLEVKSNCLVELARVQGRQDELERQYKQAVAAKRGLQEAANKAARLQLEVDTLVKFKRYLTAKVRPLFNEIAEALFHKVTKNRYSSFVIASDYDISLVTAGGYPRSLSTISGSENDLACLCMRLAIATLRSSKLAGPLGFIIMDEISSSFDNDRTKSTLEGLLELKELIPQIINITHKDVEIKFADRIITVKESGGLARVSWD